MTTPDVIRDAAIIACRLVVCRAEPLSITKAVCWAVHGDECRPRDISPVEARYVAEVLDDIEAGLGMSVSEYERTHVDAEPNAIATDLLAAAEMLPGGTAWPADVWEK